MLSEQSVNRRLQLKEMSLGQYTAEVIRDLLGSNPKIAHLDLSINMLGDKGVKVLVPQLLKSKQLVSIHFGSNEITVHGMTILFNQLVNNQSIDTINLSTEDGIQRNRIYSATDDGAIEALKRFIVENRFCHQLIMRGVSLGV